MLKIVHTDPKPLEESITEVQAEVRDRLSERKTTAVAEDDNTEGLSQGEQHSAQQRLSDAEAIARQLDLPDWSQLSTDGIYRCSYIVALRTQALQWKLRATQQSGVDICCYQKSSKTLFVQAYAPGQMNSVHLRGQIRSQHAQITID